LNPLYSNSSSRPSLAEFARGMTPERAKAQIDQMLSDGRLTQEQLRNAEQVARRMGFR